MRSGKSKKLLSLLLASATLSGLLAVSSNAAAGYTDVEDDRWSVDDIAYATDKGYMNGVGDNRFNPDGDMERAMIVTVLYRMEGEPEVEYNGRFEDVPDGEYFSDAVTWANEAGIATGTSETKFEPYSAVTREQMAAFFSRYADTKGIDTAEGADITVYEDYEDIYDYAIAPFAWANKYGIINGDTKTTLSPKKTAKREQFAAILHRFDLIDFGLEEEIPLDYAEPMANWEYNAEYALVTDANFYVAVDGSDTADGSFDHPFATFERARDAVRELKKTAKSEIKVAFKAGTYPALGNLQFTAEDSGTASVPITYCAYGDGPVIFSGGTTIPAASFKPIDSSDYYLFNEAEYSNIYKADLNGTGITGIDVLFSGSGSCYEARYPNKNPDGSDKYLMNQTTTHDEMESIELQAALPRLVAKFRTLEGAKVTGYLRTGWLVDTFPVKSYDPDTCILTFDMDLWKKTTTTPYPLTTFPLMYEGRTDDKIFFHNLSDQLDVEGEYWYDKDANVLYVYKPNGDYTVATGGRFMTINNANYLSFVGLTFNGSTEYGVRTSEAHYLTFDGCTFSNISGKYVIYIGYGQAFTLKNCELYNFGINGVEILARVKTERRLLVSQDIVIDNNYFHDFGFIDSWSQALQINEEIGTKISHNYFKDGTHGAVRYNRCIDTDIEYNVFDNMMSTSDDYGAVYTGTNVLFRSNHIRYNLFKNIRSAGGQYGIYLDDGSSGQEVYGNIFYNAGSHCVTFNGGRDNEIHDNAVINVNHSGDFLMYNPGAYRFIMENRPTEYVDNDNLYNGLKELAEIEEEYLAEWQERWPQLFRYNWDPDKVGERDCAFTTVNYIQNNIKIGTELIGTDEIYELFAEGKETNKTYDVTENPIFVDPTHGDYTIREDADFFKIPVDQIGRRSR